LLEPVRTDHARGTAAARAPSPECNEDEPDGDDRWGDDKGRKRRSQPASAGSSRDKRLVTDGGVSCFTCHAGDKDLVFSELRP